MSLNTWLNDVFEAGPSSGPKYDELEGVWQAYLNHADARYVVCKQGFFGMGFSLR